VSITEGFKTIANARHARRQRSDEEIDHVIRAEGRALFVLRDFHPFLKEPADPPPARPRPSCARPRRRAVVLSPITKIPRAREGISAVLDWSCPTARDRGRGAQGAAQPARRPQQVIESDPRSKERVSRRARLTLVEAERVRQSAVPPPSTRDHPRGEKQIIRKERLLEYYEHREEFSDVAHEILKDWLSSGATRSRRARAISACRCPRAS